MVRIFRNKPTVQAPDAEGIVSVPIETATAPAVHEDRTTATQVADYLEDPKNGFRRLDVKEIVKTLRIRARG